MPDANLLPREPIYSSSLKLIYQILTSFQLQVWLSSITLKATSIIYEIWSRCIKVYTKLL